MEGSGHVESSRISFGSIAFALSLFVVFTSLIDLFVNRLLFRAGPEVLVHMDIPGLSSVALAGRISFTFEQLVLYIILGLAIVVLLRDKRTLPRGLGLLLIPQLVSAALLYAPLSLNVTWGLSVILVLLTVVEVFGLIILRATSQTIQKRPLLAQNVFLLVLGLSFFFPLLYRASLLLGSVNISLPLSVGLYTAGIYSVFVTSVATLVYAIVVPSTRFKMSVRNFVLAAIIPTILIASILYGMIESFFMTQIFSLVIAMSTDMTLSFQFVRAIVFFWWFFLTAVIILMLKGWRSGERFLLQQGVGLVLILSTTFLFNYPNYILLGTAGVLFLTYPVSGARKRENGL